MRTGQLIVIRGCILELDSPGWTHFHTYLRCRFPWLLRTDIPPLLQYPTKPAAFAFQTGLVRMFYGLGLVSKLAGLKQVLGAVLSLQPKREKKE